jgi:hypothetical protein
MGLVKADGRDGEAGTVGEVADGEALAHGKIPLDLKLT